MDTNPTSNGKTIWDILSSLLSKTSKRTLILLFIIILGLFLLLTITGYLRFKYFDGKYTIELGSKPTNNEIIDENIAGKWEAVVEDQQYDEFNKKYKHIVSLDFSLNSSDDELLVTGHVKTYDTTGVFIGEGEIKGQGRMEQSQFARITYSLLNQTVRGFGVMLFEIDPSGKHGSGFALYRRTKSANGRFGLGKMTLDRTDIVDGEADK